MSTKPSAATNAQNETKRKALDSAIQTIEKAFGKGSIMALGSKADPIERISTGSMVLDHIVGGGLPVGRIIEIFGPESSGKTTLALHVIAEKQKAGGKCALIDAEHAFDPSYGKKLGINLDELLVSQPDYGEQALEIADYLVRSGAIDVIVVDSVAALVPKEEIESDMDKQQMGLQARLMSKALRKLTANVSRSKCVIIFINQLRAKINQGYGYNNGPTETTTGGNALKFYASVRIDVRRIGKVEKGDAEIGNLTKFKIVKNKVAPPFKTAVLEILFGEGISKESELIDLGIKYGLIEKAGSWFSFGGERIGQGRENVRKFLKTNLDARKKIVDVIKAKLSESTEDDVVNAIAGMDADVTPVESEE